MTHTDTVARLREAMSTGEVLGMVYRGGSQPGAYRLIVPVGIEGENVRARCYTSGAVKLFALAKIDLRDAAAPTAAELGATWSPVPSVVWTFATIDDVARHFRPQLEAMGWHVESGPFEDGESLRLHTRLKSGKPRRAPAIVFSYEPRAYDVIVTDDGDVVRANERARVRPWGLRARGKSSSWGRIDKAVQAFREAAGIGRADLIEVVDGIPAQATNGGGADGDATGVFETSANLPAPAGHIGDTHGVMPIAELADTCPAPPLPLALRVRRWFQGRGRPHV